MISTKEISNKIVAFLVVGLNIFYFIPLSYDFITWKSGVTKGYIEFLMPVNFSINILTITGIVSLIGKFKTKQSELLEIVLVSVLLVIASVVGVIILFTFSFLTSMIVFTIITISCLLLVRVIDKKEYFQTRLENFNMIGLFISILWIFLLRQLN